MKFNPIEILGIISSILLLISICFKTTTLKGSISLRLFNMIGSIGMAIYGCVLLAYSVIVLNTISAIINLVYLIKLLIQIKNKKENK